MIPEAASGAFLHPHGASAARHSRPALVLQLDCLHMDYSSGLEEGEEEEEGAAGMPLTSEHVGVYAREEEEGEEEGGGTVYDEAFPRQRCRDPACSDGAAGSHVTLRSVCACMKPYEKMYIRARSFMRCDIICLHQHRHQWGGKGSAPPFSASSAVHS